MKTLASTLGYPVFDELRKPKSQEIIYCKGKAAKAKGEYTEDGLVVFSGSVCNLKETPTAGNWVIGMRTDLLEKGVLVASGELLEFSSDHVFSSPSAAAAVVLGRRANGWIEWKYKDGRTLDEVKRQ